MVDIKTISQLLRYYEKLEYDINKVDFDNLNINNLIVDIHEDKIFCITLGHIKLLEYCNFNFELIDVKDILYYCNNNVIHLIENNLYDFLKKDKYTILTYCDFDLFAYFIEYLDINVEEIYDNNSLYYYISADNNFTSNHLKQQIIQKYKYLYYNYKLRLLESDMCKEEIYVFILSIYDINYLGDLNKNILTNIIYNI